MTKIRLISAAALFLAATSALAQSPPVDPSPLPPAPAEITKDKPSPPRPPLPHGQPDSRVTSEDTGPRDRPPPPERGARIHVENGRTRVDLRCADSDSTKECADALVQILDRLQSAPPRDRDDDAGARRDRTRDRDDRDRDRDWSYQ
jgi:hypothetical protein